LQMLMCGCWVTKRDRSVVTGELFSPEVSQIFPQLRSRTFQLWLKLKDKIESLKKIKEILKQSGIARFHSIADINNFIKNYNSERNKIPKIIQNELDVEISALQSDYVEGQKIYDDLKDHVSNEISRNIKSLKENLGHWRDKSNRGPISKIFLFPKVKVLANKISKLEKNFEKLIRAKTSAAEHKVIKSKNTLDKYVDFVGKPSIDANLYQYVGNSPVNWIDPLGLYRLTPAAGDPPDPRTHSAMLCFEKCLGSEVTVTGAKECGPPHVSGSAHCEGQACDLGKNNNPDLSRSDVERCFNECSGPDGFVWGYEGGPNFHLQTRPGRWDATGFRPGVLGVDKY